MSDKFTNRRRFHADEEGDRVPRFTLVSDLKGLPYIYGLRAVDLNEPACILQTALHELITTRKLKLFQFIYDNRFELHRDNQDIPILLYYVLKHCLTWQQLFMLVKNNVVIDSADVLESAFYKYCSDVQQDALNDFFFFVSKKRNYETRRRPSKLAISQTFVKKLALYWQLHDQEDEAPIKESSTPTSGFESQEKRKPRIVKPQMFPCDETKIITNSHNYLEASPVSECTI